MTDPHGVQERTLLLGLWAAAAIARKLGWPYQELVRALGIVWERELGEGAKQAGRRTVRGMR